ncbi:AraC family transcriptional regulator [bacterium SCSIO 12741]|nr:AraC family transcriptional regulator [bacterium SCSIO 12741]
MSNLKGPISQDIANMVRILNEPLQSDELHVYEFKNSDQDLLCAIPPFRSKYFSIAFVISGNFQIQMDLMDYHLSNNDVAIITADSLVQIKKVNTLEKMVVINFMPELFTRYQFQNKGLKVLESLVFKTPSHITLNNSETESLNCIALELKRRNKEDFKNAYKAEVTFHLFMAMVYELANTEQCQQNFTGKISRSQHIAYAFLKSVKQNCQTERTVGFYAKELFITPNHLSESVKKTFGKSAMKLINETTVLALKIQFSNPNLTIEQIGFEFSFSSLQHLSLFYKKHTGLSPRQYRDQLNS